MTDTDLLSFQIDAEAPNGAPLPDNEESFDWLDEECIVIRQQRAIAVYRNRFGSIVIREEGEEASDAFVVLSDNAAVSKLIQALKAEIATPS